MLRVGAVDFAPVKVAVIELALDCDVFVISILAFLAGHGAGFRSDFSFESFENLNGTGDVFVKVDSRSGMSKRASAACKW